MLSPVLNAAGMAGTSRITPIDEPTSAPSPAATGQRTRTAAQDGPKTAVDLTTLTGAVASVCSRIVLGAAIRQSQEGDEVESDVSSQAMPYTLCVLGCGTMGVAILSGVIDHLEHPAPVGLEESAPSTPMGSMILEPVADSLPHKYVPPRRPSSRQIHHDREPRRDGQEAPAHVQGHGRARQHGRGPHRRRERQVRRRGGRDPALASRPRARSSTCAHADAAASRSSQRCSCSRPA